MCKMDDDFLNKYKIGMYVYNIYDNTNNNDICVSDHDVFYYVLGCHIKNSYPNVYNILNKEL